MELCALSPQLAVSQSSWICHPDTITNLDMLASDSDPHHCTSLSSYAADFRKRERSWHKETLPCLHMPTDQCITARPHFPKVMVICNHNLQRWQAEVQGYQALLGTQRSLSTGPSKKANQCFPNTALDAIPVPLRFLLKTTEKVA